jgi:hypothetical protein
LQHYLPLDRLLVHNTANVEESEAKVGKSDVVEDDESDGEAKSRRKNSKFLEREQRQAVATNSTTSTATTTTTTSTTSTASTNGDDTFESLATETATKQVNTNYPTLFKDYF